MKKGIRCNNDDKKKYHIEIFKNFDENVKGAKVLIYVPGFDIGGIETYLINLIGEFNKKENTKITLLCRYINRNSGAYKALEKLDLRIMSMNIEHLNPKLVFRFIRVLNAFIKKEKFEIFHIHSYKEPFVIVFAKMHKIKKIILHVHVMNVSESDFGLKPRIQNIVRKRNIKRSDVILVPSMDIIKKENDLFAGKKVIIAPNCIKTMDFKFNENNRLLVRSKLNISSNDIVIGHIGRFTEVKNQSFIIDILANIERNLRMKALFVGDGPLLDEVKRKAFNYGLINRVIFLGGRNDIPILINAFDIFVFPSFYEGLGISVIEAQCNGLPCLISDTISDDAIVTELVQKKSLNEPPAMWADCLCNLQLNKNRVSYMNVVQAAGYGIESICVPVETAYFGDYQ